MKYKVGDKVVVQHVSAWPANQDPHPRTGVVVETLPPKQYRVDIGGLAVIYDQGDVSDG